MSRRKSARVSAVAAEMQKYNREALDMFLTSVRSYCKYDTADINSMSLIARRETVDAHIKELEGVQAEIRNALKNSLNILRTCRDPNFTKTLDDDLLLRVSKHAGGFGDNKHAMMAISHTCSRWRKLALGTPVLWTSIDYTSLSLAMIDHYTTQSAGHLVDVQADLGDVVRRTKCKRVLPRMRSLSVRQCTSEKFEATKWLYEQPAPKLQRVSLRCGKYDDLQDLLKWAGPVFVRPLFAGQCPKLRELELVGCRLSWASGMYRGLRRLTISLGPVDKKSNPLGFIELDVLHVFRDSPNLEEVALHSPDDFPANRPPEDALIPMRRLRFLHLSLQDTYMYTVLSAIATPPNLRLEVSFVIPRSKPSCERRTGLPRDVRCLPCLERICKLEVSVLSERIVGFLSDGGEPNFIVSVVCPWKPVFYVPEMTVAEIFSAMRGLPLHGLQDLFICEGLSTPVDVGMFFWDTGTHVRTLTMSRTSAKAFTGIARQYKNQLRTYCPELVSISLEDMSFNSAELLDACEVLARGDRTLTLTNIQLDPAVHGDARAKQPGVDALEKIRKLNYASVVISGMTWGHRRHRLP